MGFKYEEEKLLIAKCAENGAKRAEKSNYKIIKLNLVIG
jgi:hypothetical protein